MIEQAGLSRVILYENDNIVFNYASDQETIIDVVSTSGSIVDLTVLDNKYLQYTEIRELGQNHEFIYTRTLETILKGYNSTIEDLLETIKSRKGWIALLVLRSGNHRIIESPFVFSDQSSWISQESNSVNLTFQHQTEALKAASYYVGEIPDFEDTDDENGLLASTGVFVFSNGSIIYYK